MVCDFIRNIQEVFIITRDSHNYLPAAAGFLNLFFATFQTVNPPVRENRLIFRKDG